MLLSLLRALLTSVSTFNMSNCLTPPNPPASSEERKRFSTSENKLGAFVVFWAVSQKIVFWMECLCEVAVILAQSLPAQPLSHAVLTNLVFPSFSEKGVTLTPTLVVGAAMIALGTYVRLTCFRTLGKYFTFELAIRKDHKLIKTGPYMWVRHPSYTSYMLAWLGSLAVFFGDGSWLRECGVLDTILGKVVVAWTVIHMVMLCMFIVSRTAKEDKTLREQFGEEWEEWAKQVPYRVLPYIF